MEAPSLRAASDARTKGAPRPAGALTRTGMMSIFDPAPGAGARPLSRGSVRGSRPQRFLAGRIGIVIDDKNSPHDDLFVAIVSDEEPADYPCPDVPVKVIPKGAFPTRSGRLPAA